MTDVQRVTPTMEAEIADYFGVAEEVVSFLASDLLTLLQAF